MRSWLLGGAACVALSSVLLVSACGPTSHAVPPVGGLQPQGALRGAIDQHGLIQSPPAPDVTPTCKAKPSKLPGNYTVLGAYGHVKQGKFLADLSFGQSGYAVLHFAAAKATPTPTPAPTGTPLYLYVGTFSGTRPNPTQGCFALLVTQSGKPLGGHGTDNASGGGSPIFSQPFKHSTVSFGFLSALVITGLSPTGGHGTFVLDNGSTGTITLTQRIIINAIPGEYVDRVLHPEDY